MIIKVISLQDWRKEIGKYYSNFDNCCIIYSNSRVPGVATGYISIQSQSCSPASKELNHQIKSEVF